MTATNPPQEVIIGGRYRVIRELGRGGMGSVYEAENLRTRRRVALKTMRPEVSERAEFAQRFEREAQASGRLQHPNIIDVLDMGDDPTYGIVFIVQEYLNGGDLGQCLKTVAVLPPHAVLAALLPIMDALAVAHEQGIIHRDIKPDNIFLHETPQGVIPKLIDFGIAKFAQTEEEFSRTATGQMVGSPNYMSPEQARGDSDLDLRTDIWSLGVVFYKCLSRAIAYSAPTTNALLAKIIYEEPTALAQLAPHLPADLVAVVQRAVVKDRNQRWPSMRAFADALRSCALWRGVDTSVAQRWVINARGESLEAMPTATVSWMPTAPAQVAPERSSGVSSGQRSGPWGGEVPAPRAVTAPTGRASRVLAGAIAVLALGLAATAVFLWPRQPTGFARATTAAANAPAARAELVRSDAPAVAPVAPPVVTAAVQAPTPAPAPGPAPPTVRASGRVRPAAPSTRARPAVATTTTAARRGHNGALIMR